MYLSTGNLLIGETQTQLPAADFTIVKGIEYPGGKPIINKMKNSGKVGLKTTSRVCNSFNAGRGHPLNSNQNNSFW